MPKRIHQLKDFSGGLNNLKEQSDIADNEVFDVTNLTFTKQGAIGGAFNMRDNTNNLLSAYDTSHIDHIEAGYGLGYFETDYVRNSVTVEYDSGTMDSNNGFDLLESDGTERLSAGDNKRLNLKVSGTATNLGDYFPVGTRILISGVSTSSRSFAAGKLHSSAQGIYTVVGVASNDIIVDREILARGIGDFTSTRFCLNIKGFASGDKVLLLAHPDEHKIDTYSTDNTILTVDDLTPSVVGGAWEASQSHTSVTGTSNGSGSGLTCDIATDGSGDPTFTITDVGTGYVVDEEITFTDPHAGTSNTAVLIVASVNNWEQDSITLRSSASGINSKVLYHKIDDSIRCFDTADNNDCKVQWYGWVQKRHFPGGVSTLDQVNSYMGYFAKDNDLAKPTNGDCVDGATTPAVSTFATAGNGFDFNISTNTSTEGLIRSGDYIFAQSLIYDDNQESLLTDYSTEVTVDDADDFKAFSVNVGVTAPFDPRISGGRIYIKEKDSDSEYLLLVDINLTKGCRTNLFDDYTDWLDRGSSTYSCPTGTASDNFIIKDLNFITYETINGFSASIFSNALGDQGEFWKDSTVSNNRVFICNVSMKDEESGASKSDSTIKNYPDRIMYSMPNRYDTFPSFNFIEAAKGDADYYIAIESFADRILAYKQYSLDIINISSPSDTNWFLEDSKNYMGVGFHGAVAKTQYGVVWVNKQGLYFYNGSQIIDLSENKIDDDTWYSFVTTNSMIIYDEATSLAYVVKNCSSDGDAYMYDFKKGNFTYLRDFAFDSITNVVHTNFSESSNALVGTIASSSTRLYKLYRDFQSVAYVRFMTKDLDFGNSAKVKKVYAVYVTYKSDGALTGYFSLVEEEAGTNHDLNGTVATNASDYKTVKLTPSSPISCTKISIQLSTGANTRKIEINDISVEYREIHKRAT